MKKRILILIILLVIGFASVSTTLFLNGTVSLGTKENDFDVIFTSATLDGEKSDDVKIGEDKKSITFTTKRLRELNESVRLDYKVKNNSTQYGANVTISCNTYGNDYVGVTGEFGGTTIPIVDPVEMEAQEIKDGHINAEIIKVYGGEDDSISLTCTISATPTSKDKITEYIPDVYEESILNGTDPVIADGMIPVVLSDNGVVTVVDTRDVWYKYEEKKWANAVVLTDNTVYVAGDTIPEENIEAYFVWIPRYKYQIFDEGNYTTLIEEKPVDESIAKEIQIEFESKDTPVSTGSTKGSWLTHPAFTNFDVNGLWVGKFETSKTESSLQIKPNVRAWGSNVRNSFIASYEYNRNLDSHMMKNTEWGAVAYLSHSKYGINGDVNLNNNSEFMTGYSATEIADQSSEPGIYGTESSITLPYNTPTGYKASTTGNITGIYDMSGGIWEAVAAALTPANGELIFDSSDLTIYSKYLDKYPSDSLATSFNNRILGDATGEMGPFYAYMDADEKIRWHNNWYKDESYPNTSSSPILHRGSSYLNGSGGGIFSYARGYTTFEPGSRLVLAP